MDSAVQTWQDKMIGRYRLERSVGRGGMGEVWQATDTHLGRQVAIKLLLSLRLHKQGALDDFVNEARAAATLEHPHILALHDFGEHEVAEGEVIPYLVMPYVNGGTLRKRIQTTKGILPVQSSLNLLRQAALAIDYAHSKQVLHRDVKPENMLLQQDWLLLADFGLAKMLSSVSVHAKTHARAGTPEYMAPERVQGQVVPASDLYSLAVIAYQLFTGYLPFTGETPYALFVKQLSEVPPEPHTFNPHIPPAVEQVLLQGLAKQPEARPASCVAFVDGLQRGWAAAAPEQNEADATLLAPWSSRWQTSSQDRLVSVPVESLTPDLPAPVHPDNSTVMVPDIKTITSSNAVSAPERSMPSLTDASSGGGATARRAFGRRQILAAGLAGAAVAAAAGATTAAWLYGHNASANKPVQPGPVLGPKNLVAGVPVLGLTGHTGDVWVAKWDPTGRYLVTAGNDQNVMLWDLAAALHNPPSAPQTLTTPLRTFNIAGLKFDNVTDGLCWSLDGRKLIAGHSFNEKAYVLDVFGKSSTPEVYTDIVALNMGAYIGYSGVCAGPSNDHFTVMSENFIQIWRFGKTDAPEKTLVTEKSLNLTVSQIAWSSNGSNLAALASTSSDSLRFLFWRPGQLIPHSANMPQRSTYLTFFRMADTVAWSPANPNLLLISDTDIALVADQQKAQIVVALGLKNSKDTPVLGGLSWSPNGRYIAGSYAVQGDSSHGRIFSPDVYIWDIEQLRKSVSPTSPTVVPQDPTLSFGQQGALQHTQSIVDTQWSPDGRYLATASLDKQVIIWKVDRA